MRTISLLGIIALFSIGAYAESKAIPSLEGQHQNSQEHLKKMRRLEEYHRVFDDPTLGGLAPGQEDY